MERPREEARASRSLVDITPPDLHMGKNQPCRLPCIILDRERVQDDIYIFRVVVIFSTALLLAEHAEGATVELTAREFFKNEAKILGRRGSLRLSSYCVLPHAVYTVTARPGSDVMGLYKERVPAHIVEGGVDRLLTLASEMVNGWDPNEGQHEPLLRGVYWILAHFLKSDAKVGVHIPCIVLKHQDANKYLVVMMSKIPLPPPEQPALHVLEAGADIIHLAGYYIHAHEKHEVEGKPNIMQKWGTGEVTKLREDHVQMLMAS